MTVMDLDALTAELESYVAQEGWDQPPRLFALVRTGELLGSEPQLADALAGADPDGITPVEQDGVEGELGELLATIGWPPSVVGCALVNEVFLLPEEAESAMPDDADPIEWAAGHPDRRDLRVAVAVLRDGAEGSTLRVRGKDGDADELVTQPGLVPNLVAALAATLEDDEPAAEA